MAKSNNTWTPEEMKVLEGIERELIAKGVSERHAWMQAERELEYRKERADRQAEFAT